MIDIVTEGRSTLTACNSEAIQQLANTKNVDNSTHTMYVPSFEEI